jgi:hypothetical protein
MTIFANLFGDTLEVKVMASSTKEYADDMGVVDKAIPYSRREFNQDRRSWIVRDWHPYKDVLFVRSAIENAKMQLSFLP